MLRCIRRHEDKDFMLVLLQNMNWRRCCQMIYCWKWKEFSESSQWTLSKSKKKIWRFYEMIYSWKWKELSKSSPYKNILFRWRIWHKHGNLTGRVTTCNKSRSNQQQMDISMH